MSLIACDQNCKHQEEGYCTLNRIARLTGSNAAKCGYYESKNAVPEKAVQDGEESDLNEW